MALTRTTVVVTPAESYDLVTLESVKTELSFTSPDAVRDAWLEQAITQISATIAGYCGRVFPAEEITDTFADDGCNYLRIGSLELSRYPIITLDSATENGTAVDDSEFTADGASGFVYRLTDAGAIQSWGSTPLVVSYTAGYETIPADLQEIALRLVSSRYRAKGRDPSLVQRDQEGRSERFWFGSVPGQEGPYPPDIASVLNRYMARD
jgi:hypothetical protein